MASSTPGDVKAGEVLSRLELALREAHDLSRFRIDVDIHEARLLEVKELPHGSGWGTVPTPVF